MFRGEVYYGEDKEEYGKGYLIVVIYGRWCVFDDGLSGLRWMEFEGELVLW